MAPTEIKFDIMIDNHYTQLEETDLALILRVDSKQGVGNETVDHAEQGLEMPGELPSFFSWNRTVLVDGVEEEVGASVEVEDGENHTHITLVYPGGKSIIHDPKIGVLRPLTGVQVGGPSEGPITEAVKEALLGANQIFFLASLLIAVPLVITSVAIRLRRAGKEP